MTGTALLAACGGSGAATVGTTTASTAAARASTTGAATASGAAQTTSAAVTSAAPTTASAASSASVAASQQAPTAAGKTVRVLWGNPQHISGYQAVWQGTFDTSQQAHPGMKIEPNWVANSDPYRPKLLTLIASGDPGDLFWTNNANAMHEFSARKISRPLDDLVAASKVDLGQFYPHVIEMNRYQGKLYGMPQDSHPGIAGMFYDVDSFQKVGAAMPTEKWTYDDVVAVAKQMTAPNAPTPTFGLAGVVEDNGRWLTPFYSYGGAFLNADGTASTVKDAKNVDAFQWLSDLLNKDGIYPDAKTENAQKGSFHMFDAGTVAMVPAGFWEIGGNTKNIKGFTWKTAPTPVGPAGAIPGSGANDNFSIFTTSKNVEGSWDYALEWMADDVMLKVVQVGLNPASKPSVNGNPALQQLPYADAFNIFSAQLAAGKYLVSPTPANQLQADTTTAVNKAVNDMRSGQGVSEVLDNLDTALKAIIAKPLPG